MQESLLNNFKDNINEDYSKYLIENQKNDISKINIDHDNIIKSKANYINNIKTKEYNNNLDKDELKERNLKYKNNFKNNMIDVDGEDAYKDYIKNANTKKIKTFKDKHGKDLYNNQMFL